MMAVFLTIIIWVTIGADVLILMNLFVAFVKRQKVKAVWKELKKDKEAKTFVPIFLFFWPVIFAAFFHKDKGQSKNAFQDWVERYKESKMKRDIAMERLNSFKAIRKYKEENPTFEDIIAKMEKEIQNGR